MDSNFTQRAHIMMYKLFVSPEAFKRSDLKSLSSHYVSVVHVLNCIWIQMAASMNVVCTMYFTLCVLKACYHTVHVALLHCMHSSLCFFFLFCLFYSLYICSIMGLSAWNIFPLSEHRTCNCQDDTKMKYWTLIPCNTFQGEICFKRKSSCAFVIFLFCQHEVHPYCEDTELSWWPDSEIMTWSTWSTLTWSIAYDYNDTTTVKKNTCFDIVIWEISELNSKCPDINFSGHSHVLLMPRLSRKYQFLSYFIILCFNKHWD